MKTTLESLMYAFFVWFGSVGYQVWANTRRVTKFDLGTLLSMPIVTSFISAFSYCLIFYSMRNAQKLLCYALVTVVVGPGLSLLIRFVSAPYLDFHDTGFVWMFQSILGCVAAIALEGIELLSKRVIVSNSVDPQS